MGKLRYGGYHGWAGWPIDQRKGKGGGFRNESAIMFSLGDGEEEEAARYGNMGGEDSRCVARISRKDREKGGRYLVLANSIFDPKTNYRFYGAVFPALSSFHLAYPVDET